MMNTFENTFVHDPSPSYSDDEGATLPIGVVHQEGEQKFSTPQGNYDIRHANEVDIGKLPLRQGRNTFTFWTIIVVLLILTVSNLILTLTIFGVLHVGRGLTNRLEVIPEQDIIKFYGSTDLDRIYSKGFGRIDGFSDVPVTIASEQGGSVNIRLHRNGQTYNRLVMDKSGIQFRAVNAFEVKDPTNEAVIFTTTHRPHFNIPKGVETLEAKTISASRIASSLAEPLLMEADTKIAVRGSEGIFIDGLNIGIQAEHNIVINATNGVLGLEGGAGIYIDKIPIVSSEFGLRTGTVQYKICVCMPQGILFRIAIPRVHNGPKLSCLHFNPAFDPCAVK